MEEEEDRERFFTWNLRDQKSEGISGSPFIDPFFASITDFTLSPNLFHWRLVMKNNHSFWVPTDCCICYADQNILSVSFIYDKKLV